MSRRRANLVATMLAAGATVGGWGAAPPSAWAAALSPPDCDDSPEIAIWRSPESPVAGRPLRIMAVAAAGLPDEEAARVELTVAANAGDVRPTALERRPGPPSSFLVEVPKAAAGTYTARLMGPGGRVLACEQITVAARAVDRVKQPAKKGAAGPDSAAGGTGAAGRVWASRLRWETDTEALWAAWIEKLFDAPPAETPGWRPLSLVLRDPTRNFLIDHLGLGEDDAKGNHALPAAPDCADLPYFLRAYFAWKLGLPFGMRDCTRGAGGNAPVCGDLITSEHAPPPGSASGARAEGGGPTGAVKRFFRLLANKVHSGSGRTRLDDEATDYYPVALERRALRPGVVFADPYGHTLVIVKWIPQGPTESGILFAVDGQPDGSIGRKRFWEGNFLWSGGGSGSGKSGGPGFKAFRPLAWAAVGPPRDGAPGALAPTPNKDLRQDPRYAPFSVAQGKLSPDAFYAQMGRLINPRGVNAARAYTDTLDALMESLRVRLGSVDNGETYMRDNRYPVVDMPAGPKIFETMGAWEDYATPSRDMRLIIAMNVLLDLPERVVRHPDLFLLDGRKPEAVRSEIAALHARLAAERAIEYVRSDGSRWKLTVADVIARKRSFEISYNPNDCVEIRWGATPGTPEYATCKRRAPADQQARMAEYRPWFAEARRPPR